LAIPTFASADETAAQQALAKIRGLKGFTAVYRGESTTSEAKPEITIGYAAPDSLYLKVPKMNFFSAHFEKAIRIESGGEAIVMPLAQVQSLNAEAQKGLVGLTYLDLPEPGSRPIYPQLSLGLGKGTLNLGVSFLPRDLPFSWLESLEDKDATVTADGDVWKAKIDAGQGQKYVYWISQKTGVLEKMVDEKDGVAVRSLVLLELKKTAPAQSAFSNVFAQGVTPEQFGTSPTQKAQYLIGMYSGLQQLLIEKVLPRWGAMPLAQRQKVAGAVAIYWSTVFKNIFASQKAQLQKMMDDPKFIEQVKQRVSDKTAYEKFVTALPAEKTIHSKALWTEQMMGQIGYELLDSYVGWTRDQYIMPAKKAIEAWGAKNDLPQAEQEKLLAAIALPIIDSCYVTAEPIVLPRLSPLISQAAVTLEQ
jgi:hypothetical protein